MLQLSIQADPVSLTIRMGEERVMEATEEEVTVTELRCKLPPPTWKRGKDGMAVELYLKVRVRMEREGLVYPSVTTIVLTEMRGSE